MNFIKASNSETREQKCRLESLVSIFIFNFYSSIFTKTMKNLFHVIFNYFQTCHSHVNLILIFIRLYSFASPLISDFVTKIRKVSSRQQKRESSHRKYSFLVSIRPLEYIFSLKMSLSIQKESYQSSNTFSFKNSFFGKS